MGRSVSSRLRHATNRTSGSWAIPWTSSLSCAYQYKAEPGATHYGLIAEEVDNVMPELVVRDEQQQPESVQYHELVPLLLKQVQIQRQLIEQQQTQIDELRRLFSKRFVTLDS